MGITIGTEGACALHCLAPKAPEGKSGIRGRVSTANAAEVSAGRLRRVAQSWHAAGPYIGSTAM